MGRARATARHIRTQLALSLEFCRPHCRLPPNRDYTTSDGERSVRIAEAYGVGHRTCFHSGATGQALLRAYAAPGSRLPSQVEALLPDAYVLFNPGLGTDARGADWIPTVRALLAARRPLLLTALDKSDAVRDEAVMSTELERWHSAGGRVRTASPYAPNHFGSLLNYNLCTLGEMGLESILDGLSDGSASFSTTANAGWRVVV